MNLIELRHNLNILMLHINSKWSEEEKMNYFNTEVQSYLNGLVESEVLRYVALYCDSSNQQAGDYVTADIAVSFQNTPTCQYIQLKTKR